VSFDILAVLQSHSRTFSVELLATEEISGRALSSQSFRLHAHENGHDWKLIIHVSNTFPVELPRISIENAVDYSAIGHVNWHGEICYIDKQGLVIDYNRPQDVLLECIDEALETLNDNFNDPLKTELQNDFKSYWESIPSYGFKTTCFVTTGEKAKEL
jgi:hypothetical protein